MTDNVVTQFNTLLSTTYDWHPKFNVYRLDNQSVLLLSEGQQLLFSCKKYPWASFINGKSNLHTLMHTFKGDFWKSPMLFQQYENFVNTGLLVKRTLQTKFVRPSFELFNAKKNSWSQEALGLQILNLSELSNLSLSHVKDFLKDVFAYVQSALGRGPIYQLVLVDDFLDSRIKNINFNHDFLFLKVSGDEFWISPIFKATETAKAHAMLQQILNNQPVRKLLINQFPSKSHGLPYYQDVRLTEEHCKNLTDLLISQVNNESELVIYNKGNHDVGRHPVVIKSLDKIKFTRQIQSPVRLVSCITPYNKDGGSRCIPAIETVKKLSRLVSPITGLINHLDEVNASEDAPIKIYRSGFFKTPDTLQDLNEGSFVQLCMGKGVDIEQSKASALCEALERYGAVYQEDVPLLKSSYSELTLNGTRSITYQAFQNFSDSQYQSFSIGTNLANNAKQLVRPYDDSEIHWLPVWSLYNHEKVYIPLSLCFAQLPFQEKEFGRWHSNGCAAGNTLEEAVFQAMLELIERDASAMWWYNRATRPLFDLDRLDRANLVKIHNSLCPSKERGHDYWVVDLTHDLGVPVMAAVGKDRTTGGWILGFGCHLLPELAAQRALTELCQLIPIREQNSAPFDFNAIEDHEFLYGLKSQKQTTNYVPYSDDINENIKNIVKRLGDCGLETLVLNYSRSHIPVKTVKVFIPGLCHIWPQLGNDRLYFVPLSLSWVTQANNESSINKQGLYI